MRGCAMGHTKMIIFSFLGIQRRFELCHTSSGFAGKEIDSGRHQFVKLKKFESLNMKEVFCEVTLKIE
jgi:hypothetical protein